MREGPLADDRRSGVAVEGRREHLGDRAIAGPRRDRDGTLADRRQEARLVEGLGDPVRQAEAVQARHRQDRSVEVAFGDAAEPRLDVAAD